MEMIKPTSDKRSSQAGVSAIHMRRRRIFAMALIITSGEWLVIQAITTEKREGIRSLLVVAPTNSHLMVKSSNTWVRPVTIPGDLDFLKSLMFLFLPLTIPTAHFLVYQEDILTKSRSMKPGSKKSMRTMQCTWQRKICGRLMYTEDSLPRRDIVYTPPEISQKNIGTASRS